MLRPKLAFQPQSLAGAGNTVTLPESFPTGLPDAIASEALHVMSKLMQRRDAGMGTIFESDMSRQLALVVRCAVTGGYLSFHPMAQCVVHALKGLAYRARQSFLRTLRSQTHIIFFSGSKT